ncbi:putative L,D-transpeptidase YkuD [Synechococcus sp. MIT S9509]|nr:putative L,D-transpeptidase YkuD [Synechococcus sp. MIT S9504]KZR92982.1 putative L,D-transpeptidase YkuD [Synechococcus sp. MIT S9509]
MRLMCVGCSSLLAVGAVSVALAASDPAVASPQLQAPLFASAKVHSVNAETSIHLDLKQRRISVIRAGQSIGRWPVAIGDPKTPTPTGVFRVETKLVNPQYESTKSGRVHPVTGPASPLGHRWIGFLQQGPNQFGIHGTPWPHWVKIRAAVSNGCVRMLNAHVQKLYELVDVGTPVMITR